MINNNGHACLTGFSLLTTSEQLTTTSPAKGCGTIRWTSPELLFPEEFGFESGCPTKESDCYSLGMVIYEVLSGEVPFAAIQLEVAVIVKVLEGERPRRPEKNRGKLFTDSIWEVLGLCWKPQPQDRINARAVLIALEEDTIENIEAGGDEEPLIAHGNNGPLGSQMDNLKGGSIGSRMVHKAHRMFRATAKKLHGLHQA